MNYVDLHIHGAFGVDLVTADAGALDRLARGLADHGYDAFLPTLVPLRPDELDRVADRLGAWMSERRSGDGRGAMPIGVHFEGPFVSSARSGALHADCFLDGSDARALGRFFATFERFPGMPMVTLAPEIPGGLELVAEFRRRKTLVSIGHTDATYARLEAAFAAGARHMTHFCNAMRPLHHREPGPIAFGLLQREISVDVIADGHHLHPRMLELVARAKDDDRFVLISDAMPAAGLADGVHEVWGESLVIRDGAARNAGGALAGATALLDRQTAILAASGVGETRARHAASLAPRRVLERAHAS